MEIVFFVAHPDAAGQIASSDDLPGDVAAEPLRVDGPEALLGLATAFEVDRGGVVRQMRDATCRSYPVWSIAESLCDRLVSIDDDEVDARAAAWAPHAQVDLDERATCLTELREALRSREAGERLFALFEERAF